MPNPITPAPLSPAQVRILDQNQRLIAALETDADSRIRTSADGWSKGIAALFALVGAAAWFEGPALFNSIDAPWRGITLALVLVGVALEIWGLLLLLRVSSGSPTMLALNNFSVTNTVSDFIAKMRTDNVERIRLGRGVALTGLIAFAVAFAVLVLAQPNTTKLSVTIEGGAVCSVVESADNQQIVLKVAGKSETQTIKFADVLNLKSVPACG